VSTPGNPLRAFLARYCAEHQGGSFFQSSILRDARNAIGAEQATWSLLKHELNRLRGAGTIKAYTDCIWIDGKPGWFTIQTRN